MKKVNLKKICKRKFLSFLFVNTVIDDDDSQNCKKKLSLLSPNLIIR